MKAKSAVGAILSAVLALCVLVPAKFFDERSSFWIEQLWRMDGSRILVCHVTLDGFFIFRQDGSSRMFDYVSNLTGKSLWKPDCDLRKLDGVKYSCRGISEGNAILVISNSIVLYDVTTGSKTATINDLPNIWSLYPYNDYIFVLLQDLKNNQGKAQILTIDAISRKVISRVKYPESLLHSGKLNVVGMAGEDALLYSDKFDLVRFSITKRKIIWKTTSKQGLYPNVTIVGKRIVSMNLITTKCGEIGKSVSVLDSNTGKKVWSHPYEGDFKVCGDRIYLWNDNFCDKPSKRFLTFAIENGEKIADIELPYLNASIAANEKMLCVIGRNYDYTSNSMYATDVNFEKKAYLWFDFPYV